LSNSLFEEGVLGVNVEDKKFFEDIQAQKEKDRLLWNRAQEPETETKLPIEKEYEIMERMFLVNTILKLQEKIERMETLQKNCDSLTRHFAKDVKHLFPLENTPGYGQLCERVLEQKEEIDRLRFRLGWPKK
jgi:aspartate oxidase